MNGTSILNIEELIYYSRQFANMFGLPVRIYENSKKIYSYSPINFITDPIILCEEEILKKTAEIAYHIYDDFFYYGIVNHKSYKFVVGPVSELTPSDHDLKRIAFLLNINESNPALFISEMKNLSGIHLDTLIQMIILYNFTVNKTMYDISEIRIKTEEQTNISTNFKSEDFYSYVSSDFKQNYSRSYLIERDMIKKTMSGDVQGLIDGATKIPSVSSGELAPHLLRHHKNFFIRLETIISRAAIEAGLDVEEVFSLEEKYIEKCESLNNIDRIKNLQYHMIIDYADRVNKNLKYNENDSKLVNKITKYIRNHISENIKTSDIADFLGKSRGGVTTEFKKITGVNLSDFIKIKKIQEAEELLYQTDKSLVAISEHLGFSSQAHFCRVFKDIKGMTPTEYRNKNSI